MSRLMQLVVLGVLVGLVKSHGYLKSPLARSATTGNNQGVWCGNVQQNLAISNCGRCGEAPGGSEWSTRGPPKANYTSGSTIEVEVEYQAGHNGYYEIELCSAAQESNNCFQKLPIVGGTELVREGNRICVPYDNGGTKFVKARVQLPSGVRCSACTLRWTYKTAYPIYWPENPVWTRHDCVAPDRCICYDPEPSQVFRNCADIAIV